MEGVTSLMRKLGVVFVLACLASSVNAGPRLKVYIGQASRAEVIVQALVEQAPENRALEVVAESEDFYRSSMIELDGERAPRLNSMVLKKMPSGLYEVTVIVLNAKGDTIARDFKWVRVV